VWQIAQDKAGQIWLTTDEMLVKFDHQSKQFIHYPLPPGERRLAVFHQDSAGTVWVAGVTGLYRFNPQDGTFIPYESAPREISSLMEDENGNFWLGSQQTGLSILDPRTGQIIRRYRHDPADRDSLSSNQITALYKDEAGVIWIGTENSGLNVFDPRQSQFAYYRHQTNNPRSLAEGPVVALAGDENGLLWAGTGTVLNRIGPDSVQHYSPADHLEASAQDNISALHIDRLGLVWLGMDRKLYRFDPETESFTDYELRLSTAPGPPLRVTAFYEDNAGYLWLAVELTGLYRFDPNRETFKVYQQPRNPQVTNYDEPHNIANNRITTLSGDRQGEIWLGYQNGALSRFDPQTETFRHYFFELGRIDVIYQDQAGLLWLASQDGLAHFEPTTETVRHYTRKDGLSDDFVVGILEDRTGNLWLSTKQGLSKFDPQAEQFHNYDLADGLSDNEFSRGAAWQTPDGRLFFGGRNGLTGFDPAQINHNPYQPPVLLTEFRLFNQPVRPGRDSLLARPVWDLAQMTLQPDQDIISFEFAALSYTAPQQNRYRYKLEGFEDDWNEVDSRRRFATYTNLPPGDYLFRVQGTNHSGVWSEKEAHLSLTVLPFWWETTWFRVTALLLVAAIATGGYGVRVYRLKQRSRQLEQQVAQRTAELAQAREIFATVLNNQDALIYVADMNTYEILFANDRLKQTFGDIEGRTCWQTIQEGQTGPCSFCSNPELVSPAGQPTGIFRWQYQNTRNDRWYAIADSAIEWTDGRLVRLSMAMDITTHKRAEQQLLAQQRLVATMEERERIGRELHDDLGQVMGYVSLQAQAVREFLKHGHTEQAKVTLTQLLQTAHEAHDDVRQYILGVRSSTPQPPADFFEELNRYLQQLQERYNLEVQVSWPDHLPDTPLVPEIETQLLRIIQEALTNVRKHAGVDTARILFTFQPDEVQVIISDEGRGFNPYRIPSAPGEGSEAPLPLPEAGDGLSPKAQAHFGLEIMRERAEAAGGTLDLRSKPGQGTQIIVHLPRVLERSPEQEVSGLRVLLVDDHPLYLEGLRNMLSTRGLQVVGTAHDGLEATALARQLLPDLILMDVEMPGCDGLEATRRIKAELPGAKIVILTVAADDDTLLEALKSGAAGYLLKNLDSRQFFSLLTEVMRGETVLSPSLAARVLTEFTQSRPTSADNGQERESILTPRQQEVLELAAAGLTNKEIAQKLHVSPATVKYHVAQILDRLQLTSRYELAHYARPQNPPDG
jgi:DNA-binding NarL/FixJ family response regulator/signal transduction histidine kinase/ligand-binding sensor domain-containing protein